MIFQSTLPRRERQHLNLPESQIINFNPHSHEGSDSCCLLLLLPAFISIHTPTKGATASIKYPSACKYDFNPHSHEGSDILLICKEFNVNISIHTPTKGATCVVQILGISDVFQSTLPRRERRRSSSKGRYIYQDFNPHSHEGSDS